MNNCFYQDQIEDPSSTLAFFKTLLKFRKSSPALQSSRLTFAHVSTEIFSFLRIPVDDDEQTRHQHAHAQQQTPNMSSSRAPPSSFLIAMNFGNVSVRADYYTRDLFGAKSVVKYSNTTGVVVVSSNMDRNGEVVDLRSLRLTPGEALLVETSPAIVDGY